MTKTYLLQNNPKFSNPDEEDKKLHSNATSIHYQYIQNAVNIQLLYQIMIFRSIADPSSNNLVHRNVERIGRQNRIEMYQRSNIRARFIRVMLPDDVQKNNYEMHLIRRYLILNCSHFLSF